MTGSVRAVSGAASDLPRSMFGEVLSPRVEVIASAYLTPPEFDGQTEMYSGAVYDAQGALVLSSLRPSHFVSYRPVDPITLIDGSTPGNVESLDQAVYGGHFFFAWGHFLVETLASSAYLLELPECPLVFTPFDITYENDWTRWYVEHVSPLIRAAGWGDREIVINRGALRVGELHLPGRLSVIDGRPGRTRLHPQVNVVFDRVRDAFIPEGLPEKLVCVRRYDGHRRAHPAELALYDWLNRNEVPTVDPSAMSTIEQVATFGAAQAIIGFSGSGLHNSLFMDYGTKVVEIGDDPGYVAPNPMQKEICRIREQELVFLPGHNAAGPLGEVDLAHAVSRLFATV